MWEHDVDALLAATPHTAHLVFVPTRADGAGAAMQARLDAATAALPAADAAYWRSHLHVAAAPVGQLGSWLDDALAGPERNGLAIDHAQRIRGLGHLADVTRFDPALQSASQWPWKANLAYLAHEIEYLDAEAVTAAALAADGATVVPLWQAATIGTTASVDVTLPDLTGFDHLDVEITLACPDPTRTELASCGAWDYLAQLTVTTPHGEQELTRAITPYHRGAHWVIDATPLLPLLATGAAHFTWTAAPSWNPQPTVTTIALRFGHRGGARPVDATTLFTGGAFDATYDTGRAPVPVVIPADATRVELVVLATGHGGATDNCAEFCDHTHEFTVGTTVHTVTFPAAGTDTGCMAAIADGMTPNQGGTWWFGRAGWCPGGPVALHRIDVTADVVPGTPVAVSYRGLYAGAPPTVDRGNLALSSWLVVYR